MWDWAVGINKKTVTHWSRTSDDGLSPTEEAQDRLQRQRERAVGIQRLGSM